MNAKDKALELYLKFEDKITGLEGNDWWDSAKNCALIAVGEIWENCQDNMADYWLEVKQEIIKL